MSSRVLKKLYGDKDLPVEPSSDTEDNFVAPSTRKKQLNINRFDLLNQQSQSESEVKEDDDENDIISANNTHIDTKSKDSSRKKKKKKKRKVSRVNLHSSEDIDEVERSVREVNAILGDISSNSPSISKETVLSAKKGILSVEHKHFNPKNELKKMFGSKVIHAESMRKRNRGRSHVKNVWLVTPKDHWPNVGKPGILMKMLENKNGIQYFTYEHASEYRSVQYKFLEAVESLNPDNLVAIMNNHPYHIDTLIQLSEICKLSEDLSMATELIERALYCLESCFHPLFNFVNGTCRLDYRRQENRSLYITLFKHSMFVGQRACYRTALEFCKLILSLEPDEDPLCVVLAIDFFAIRAREYKWLLEFYENLNPVRNLNLLPNFAYSMAVVHFYLELEDADELLQYALLTFPGVLLPLLDKCSISPDTRTLSHTFFNSAQTTQEPSLTQLVTLYVCRSYHLWKEKDLLPWLEKNAQIVLDRVDVNDPIVSELSKKRSRCYKAKPPRCIERHMFLSDLKEVMPSMQEASGTSTTMSFDPLPPLDSINIYTPAVRRRELDTSGPLASFLSSLMPNYNPNQPRQEPVDQAAGGGDENASDNLHRSVTNLLDAMRDFLSNLPFPTVDADGEQDSGPDTDDAQ